MASNPERRSNNIFKAAGLAGGVAVAAAAIYYATGEHKASKTGLNPSPESTTILRLLEQPGAEEASPQAVIDLFNDTKELNQGYFDSRRQSSQDELRNIAKQITISKTRAMWAVSHFPNSPFIRTEGNVLIFSNGKRMDLDKNTDFVIGVAAVDYYFQGNFGDVLADELLFDRQKLDDYGGLEHMFWLRDNVQFDMGDIPPVARTQDLEQLTYGLKFLKETGIELPKKAKLDFFNRDEDPYSHVDGSTIVLKSISYTDGGFSAGGSVGDYFVSKKPDFLQKYRDTLNAVYQTHRNQVTEPRLLSSDDYGYLYSDDEELPMNINNYIYDGVSFRKKIAYANATGHTAEASVLQAKYDYIKGESGGIETSVDGIRAALLACNVGDVLRISDYEGYARTGIYLRETPTLVIDPNRPSVTDNQTVQILEGPVTYLDDSNLEATQMWKIQVGTVANERFFVSYAHSSGWISEEWFGQKRTLE